MHVNLHDVLVGPVSSRLLGIITKKDVLVHVKHLAKEEKMPFAST